MTHPTPCPRCTEPLPGDARYCRRCGMALRPVAPIARGPIAAAAPVAVAGGTTPVRWTPLAVVTFAACGAAAAAGVVAAGALWFGTTAPVPAGRQVFSAGPPVSAPIPVVPEPRYTPYPPPRVETYPPPVVQQYPPVRIYRFPAPEDRRR